VPVRRAAQHARQKGVIHTDIKPANVHDRRPVPKVIDFGVALAAGEKPNEHAVSAAAGQMAGAPRARRRSKSS
jgi:serine/threonine protein kinase